MTRQGRKLCELTLVMTFPAPRLGRCDGLWRFFGDVSNQQGVGGYVVGVIQSQSYILDLDGANKYRLRGHSIQVLN